MTHVRLRAEPALLSVLAIEALNGTVMSLGPDFRHEGVEVLLTS